MPSLARRCALVLATLLALLSGAAHAQDPAPADTPSPDASTPAEDAEAGKKKQKKPSKFIDPEDGAPDVSEFLASPGGFLPLMSVITEPAIGFGPVFALLFIHGKPRVIEVRGHKRYVAPSMTVAAAGFTTNGTWLVGAGGMYRFADDTVRASVFAGYFDVHLTWYGEVGDSTVPAPFILEGYGGNLQTTYRLGNTPLWLGLKYQYFQQSMSFDEPPPRLEDLSLDAGIGGLGGVVQLDTRDSVFTPDHGVQAAVTFTGHASWLGSDYTFQKLNSYCLGWTKPAERWVIGVRGDVSAVFGDVPPWALPFIRMRGIPAMRYVGRTTALVEVEPRWDFTKRFSAILFGGLGVASAPEDTEGIWAVGLGGRYLIARQYKLRVGVDVARGPEQFAFYLTTGTAWPTP